MQRFILCIKPNGGRKSNSAAFKETCELPTKMLIIDVIDYISLKLSTDELLIQDVVLYYKVLAEYSSESF